MQSRVVPLRCEQVFTCLGRDLRTFWLRPPALGNAEERRLSLYRETKQPIRKMDLETGSLVLKDISCRLQRAEKAHDLNGTWVNYHKIASEVVGIILPTWQGQIQMWCPKRALLRSSEWKEVLITCICLKTWKEVKPEMRNDLLSVKKKVFVACCWSNGISAVKSNGWASGGFWVAVFTTLPPQCEAIEAARPWPSQPVKGH